MGFQITTLNVVAAARRPHQPLNQQYLLVKTIKVEIVQKKTIMYKQYKQYKIISYLQIDNMLYECRENTSIL